MGLAPFENQDRTIFAFGPIGRRRSRSSPRSHCLKARGDQRVCAYPDVSSCHDLSSLLVWISLGLFVLECVHNNYILVLLPPACLDRASGYTIHSPSDLGPLATGNLPSA